MRKLKNGKIETVICNCCGKTLKSEQGYLKEECVNIEHVFGYFSKKDGIRQKLDLCEDCFDKIVASFVIPVEESEENELL